MLFFCVNGYLIIVIELPRYGRYSDQLLSCCVNTKICFVVRFEKVSSPRYLTLYDTQTFVSIYKCLDDSGMIRAGYEVQSTWIFIRGLLLTCKLSHVVLNVLIMGRTELGIWQSATMERTFWNSLF